MHSNNAGMIRMIIMDKCYSRNHGSPKLPDICLTGEEKPHPGNLYQPGIEPGSSARQARTLPPAPRRRTLIGVNSLKPNFCHSLNLQIFLFLFIHKSVDYKKI